MNHAFIINYEVITLSKIIYIKSEYDRKINFYLLYSSCLFTQLPKKWQSAMYSPETKIT